MTPVSANAPEELREAVDLRGCLHYLCISAMISQ
ncbi:MAG TPA: hypothetical protein DEB17_03975 [Chlorobaculum sp.]|uniref:Uncharacterized protein n=1 Tax=Chlorobaculum tepidum (strain ATCC 49652 / DSM 12025 / NBRC 103806 / TLS) TaxID=194439 RepID=Q8KE00_CHLTE|nr:hypothetical protein CT0894 [Chlorobaculum tepidum TLS]HBU23144.1 hypothetical protein [Chlorobaculum sp.]